MKINELHRNLRNINSVTKVLQRENNIELSDIRALFDGLIEKYPEMSHHLSKDADIVHCKNFESGVVNCILGLKLTECKKKALGVLENNVIQVDQDVENEDFAENILLTKRRKTDDSTYGNLCWIVGTSNICERLFSRAKLNIGYSRHNITPMHLEAELFLSINKKFWDAELISCII